MGIRSEPHPLAKFLVHIVCYGAAFSMLAPFLWMVSASLKTNEEIFVWPPRFLPATPMFGNYVMAWEKARIGRFFLNSIVVSAVVTAGSLFFNSLAGFAFAKLRFPGRDRIFFGLLMTMMLPAQVSVIFAYLLMVRLGYAGTYQALILPGLAGAFGIFYMRQSVASVPNDLMDAGRIDGLTDFELFLHIVMPLVRPAALRPRHFHICRFMERLLLAADHRGHSRTEDAAPRGRRPLLRAGGAVMAGAHGRRDDGRDADDPRLSRVSAPVCARHRHDWDEGLTPCVPPE